jgi:hypothetical protein
MRRLWIALALGSLVPQALTPVEPKMSVPRSGLGLDVALDAGVAAEVRQRVLAEIRRTGVNVFSLTLSWSAAEPEAGKYDLGEFVRSARLLRQSGATLHLDVPIVVGPRRDVPRDLETVAFDDARFSARFAQLLAALEPALLDASTISLGYAADAYFADRKEELEAYVRLFRGAADLLKKNAPQLFVGVTTTTPMESATPAVATALQESASVSLYIYAPFQRGNPFLHRTPDTLDRDWKLLLDRSGGRPIAFPEVSYSSSRENGSSPERQAEFVRRLRRFLAASDGRRLMFARYSSWRDTPVPHSSADLTPVGRRRVAFLANRGLETADGQAKPAWTEWVKEGR